MRPRVSSDHSESEERAQRRYHTVSGRPLDWKLWTGLTKALGTDGILGVTKGKISGRGVCSNDSQRHPVGSFFVHGYKERRIEGASVVRVEHLQAFDDAVSDQEFTIYFDLPRIPIAMGTDQGARQGPD